MLILDECFLEFVEDKEAYTMTGLLEEYPANYIFFRGQKDLWEKCLAEGVLLYGLKRKTTGLLKS